MKWENPLQPIHHTNPSKDFLVKEIAAPFCQTDVSRELRSVRSLCFLVALYRAMRLRFGYGFESCDANGPRNVKNTNLATHRAVFFPRFSLLEVRNWS